MDYYYNYHDDSFARGFAFSDSSSLIILFDPQFLEEREWQKQGKSRGERKRCACKIKNEEAFLSAQVDYSRT